MLDYQDNILDNIYTRMRLPDTQLYILCRAENKAVMPLNHLH